LSKQQQQHEEQREEAREVEPGMAVEATRADIGEKDVSPPRVSEVERDAQGNVEEIVVQKGVLFKKELKVPVERIHRVKRGDKEGETVVIEASKNEVADLSSAGSEEFPPLPGNAEQKQNLLDEVEETIPTAEGLRGKELETPVEQAEESSWQEGSTPATEPASTHGRFYNLLHTLGPGFLGGMAGNDASAVGSYSIDGAQNGFGHLWLLLLATPLYYSVLFSCAKIGRVSQQGLANLLRKHYGRPAAMAVSLLLIISNIALIAADLAAISTGLELITNGAIAWFWFIIPVAVILWYFTVFRNFESLKQIFITMSLAFAAYLFTAVWAKPDWGAVLFNTLVPHVDLTFASISSAVALLGATISPYNIFWQVQGEKEEKRFGTRKEQLREVKLDMGVGVISGNLVAYAIILSTASTLFIHHQSITTAADAAKSLVPLLGPFAKYLFALGFIGAGLVAIPVLLASTSYAVAGTIGWPVGLSKHPWQNEGFYLILTLSLVVSMALVLVRIDPIQLIFWANVLSGVLTPFLVIALILVGTNRKIMGTERLTRLTIIFLLVTVLVMIAAAALLFYGLLTGQSG
jgi:NRAMP (natural resistance-associated macrophage protein)-like metal ion transporter